MTPDHEKWMNVPQGNAIEGRKRHVGRTSHELHAPQPWEKGTASSAITNDGPQGADLELINEWKAECELRNQLGVENMCAMAE